MKCTGVRNKEQEIGLPRSKEAGDLK